MDVVADGDDSVVEGDDGLCKRLVIAQGSALIDTHTQF